VLRVRYDIGENWVLVSTECTAHFGFSSFFSYNYRETKEQDTLEATVKKKRLYAVYQ